MVREWPNHSTPAPTSHHESLPQSEEDFPGQADLERVRYMALREKVGSEPGSTSYLSGTFAFTRAAGTTDSVN